jgi:hypothetical protein
MHQFVTALLPLAACAQAHWQRLHLLQLEQELALAADKTSTNVTCTRELESPAVVHIPAE